MTAHMRQVPTRGAARPRASPLLTGGVAALALLATGAAAGAQTWTGPAFAARPAARVLRPAAVFGVDRRTPLPPRLHDLQEKLGLLFNTRARSVCTAFCVAKDIVATAGHCLHRTAGEHPPQLADFWFARNYDAVRDFAHIAGFATGAAAQHVMSGAESLSIRPPIDAAKDWALVRLSRPACSKGALELAVLAGEQIIKEAEARRVFHVSYHRDFTPWKLAYCRDCTVARNFEGADWATIARDFINPTALILHTCATGGASSGSPVLLETPTGPAVIGINIGTYLQSKVVMQAGQVTRRLKADVVANTAVSSAAFAAQLEIFRGATILATGAQIRELQTRLRQRGLFTGRVDGTYGAALHAAIEAHERAAGLPVTGLATAALLQALAP
jgi:protease YdgD